MNTTTLEFHHLHKRYDSVFAVKDLSFHVQSGKVTGLLGPNGSGKTTTLRSLLGLVRPTSGQATIHGKQYLELERPAQTIGTVLEANSFHPAHTAYRHLYIQTLASGIPKTRIDEVLEQTGMTQAAHRKIGGYSLGMRQRLGLASALLGEPEILVMDEPINGLDPQGITWMRHLLKFLASEGRTVLISSHLLTEVEQTVDELIIINRGELVYEGEISGLAKTHEVFVDSTDRDGLERAFSSAGFDAVRSASGFKVTQSTPEEIGRLALTSNLVLTRLQLNEHGLEEGFLALIGDAQ